MSTMNISVTDDQVKLVDDLVLDYGYANRSEFFRSVLRYFLSKPFKIKSISTELEFVEFEKKPLTDIKKMLETTGKYDKKFVKNLVSGLKRSSVYANT